MAGRCGRTAQSTTRCRISIARCRHQPIVQCILQRAVDNRQPHTLVITSLQHVAINKITTCCRLAEKAVTHWQSLFPLAHPIDGTATRCK